MDRIADVELFLRIVDLGSISAAARSLDLSVAVASQRLQRLERDLGVRLVQRTTRRLHVTAEDDLLARQGRVLVDELHGLTASLRDSGGVAHVAGTLRMTASAAFGQQYISPLLPAFLARYPAVRVSLDLDDRFSDMVGSGHDLAIRIGVLEDSSLIGRRLVDNRRVLCASPDYLALRGTPRTPADLVDHEAVLLFGRDGRQDLWRLQAPGGEPVTVRMRSRLDSNFGDAMRTATLAGFGISLHSLWHVHEDLRAGRLQVVLPDYALPPSAIHALMPRRALVPQRVTAMIDFLLQHIGDPPAWERGFA